jgi:hypothetical protein
MLPRFPVRCIFYVGAILVLVGILDLSNNFILFALDFFGFIPAALLFTTFCILNYHVAKLYYSVFGQSYKVVVTSVVYIVLNVIVYVVQILLLIPMIFFPIFYMGVNIWVFLSYSWVSVFYLLLAGMFVFNSVRLFVKIRKDLTSSMRETFKRFNRIGAMTIVCVLCFVFRAIVGPIRVFAPDLLGLILFVLYFAFGEILPVILQTIIFSTSASMKRNSPKYHSPSHRDDASDLEDMEEEWQYHNLPEDLHDINLNTDDVSMTMEESDYAEHPRATV